MINDQSITKEIHRPLFEDAVVERLKESGFLEIEIRTECLHRVGDGYQDEVVNAGWHYWNAALVAGADASEISRCPICAEPFKPEDLCAEDISEGTCHAACLEGSPVVDLETGAELPDGEFDTYRFSEVMDPPTPSPQNHLSGLKPLKWHEIANNERTNFFADSVIGKWEFWQITANGHVYICPADDHQGTLFEGTTEEAKTYLERAYIKRMSPALATEGKDNG